MNRLIKFRAWDKVQKKFLWPWPDGFYLFGETTCFDLIEQQVREYVPDGQRADMRMNDVEIMQYTGLKDKNGKEIYEGDVIKGGVKEESCIVKWQDVCGRWIAWGKIYKIVPHKFCMFTVIGNVFENPELMR